jgi:hypothetical protein
MPTTRRHIPAGDTLYNLYALCVYILPACLNSCNADFLTLPYFKLGPPLVFEVRHTGAVLLRVVDRILLETWPWFNKLITDSFSAE